MLDGSRDDSAGDEPDHEQDHPGGDQQKDELEHLGRQPAKPGLVARLPSPLDGLRFRAVIGRRVGGPG